MHIGTFTPEGTWAAAARELPRAGASWASPCIEVMPVAEFPGRFGWGYDGVDLFAPDAALRHARRLPPLRRRRARAGPRRDPRRGLQPLRPGRQLPRRSSPTTTSPTATRPSGARRSTSTAPDAGPVREFFVANAGYWIDEFHLDGLRLDATQAIYDDSAEHILAAIGRAARARRPGGRSHPRHRRERAAGDAAACGPPSEGGYGLDALWNDDFHHARDGRAHRPPRGLLQRLPRHAAGVHLGGRSTASSTRASATPGRSKRRGTPALGPAAARVRHLPPEPRPGRQLGARPALSRS